MAFVTFGEPHGAGHYLWHIGDARYPSHPPGAAAGLGHLRDVYEAVDRAIGDILARIDDEVTVIVISGDGMGPNYAGSHLLPDVLHRLGLFHSANVGGGDGAGARPSGASWPPFATRSPSAFGSR